MAFYDSPGFGGPAPFSGEVSGIKFLHADREPCPVCGHPSGDCPGEDISPPVIWGYNSSGSLDDTLTFYVEEDYYEERELAPGITAKFLIHKKGKTISLREAKELGLAE